MSTFYSFSDDNGQERRGDRKRGRIWAGQWVVLPPFPSVEWVICGTLPRPKWEGGDVCVGKSWLLARRENLFGHPLFPSDFFFFLLMIVFWGGAIKTWETRFSFFYFEWGLFQKQSSVFRNLRSFFWKFLIRNSASTLCILFLFFGPSGGVGGGFCSFHSFHSLPESLEKISLLIALPPL